MRQVFVVMVLAAALSGCWGDKAGGPQSSGSGSTSGGPANHAPLANLTANVTTGMAPLAINFTLNGTDGDGDALTWVLSFGDGSVNVTGSSLPASVVHDFGQAANFTVRLEITDGQALVNATLVIAATPPVPEPGFTPIHREGGPAVLCPQCTNSVAYNTCAGLKAKVNEFDCFFFEVPATSAGHTVTASSDNPYVNVQVMTDCSGEGEGLYRFVDGVGSSPYSFILPAGSGCVLFFEYADVPPALIVDIV